MFLGVLIDVLIDVPPSCVQEACSASDAVVARDLTAWVDRQHEGCHPSRGRLYQHKIPTAWVHVAGMHSVGMPATFAALRAHIGAAGGHTAALSAKQINSRASSAKMMASLFEQVARMPAPLACGMRHLCLWLSSQSGPVPATEPAPEKRLPRGVAASTAASTSQQSTLPNAAEIVLFFVPAWIAVCLH